MKKVAGVLLAVIVFIFLALVYFLFSKFLFEPTHSTEKKILAIFIAILVLVPIFGRIIHVIKDGNK